MGRRKKHKKAQNEETAVKETSPRQSSSGAWKVVRVNPDEVKSEDEHSDLHGTSAALESVTTLNEKAAKDASQSTETSIASEPIAQEEENNTSPFKKSGKTTHRKRKYREANKDSEGEANDGETKKERKERDATERRPDWSGNRRDSGGPYMGGRLLFDRHRTDMKAHRKKSFSVYELSDRKEAVVVLRHPADVVLWGHARCQVVWGSVTIFGYTLTHTSLERWPVYSPACNSYIKVNTLPLEESSSADLCKNAVEQYVGTSIENEDLHHLLAEINDHTIILSLCKLNEKYTQFICSISPFQDLYPSAPKSNTDDQDVLRKLGVVILTDRREGYSVDIGPDMRNARQELLLLLEAGENPVVVICGGKNVGKSTLARFLTNTVLNHRKEVAYLECDVGQTEFTPPGCVALNIIRQPVLGPPFTHQRRAERWCFFGAASPGDDPGRYLRCLRYVHEAYCSLPLKPTLIVNTMGWNRGLGLTFMADTLRMVSPTVVMQINSSSEGRNFPPLHSQFVHNTPSWWQNQEGNVPDVNGADYRHKLISLSSAVESRLPSSSRYEPLDHRNLALFAELSRVYETAGTPAEKLPPLHTVRPYKVPWSAVALHVSHAPVPNSQILNVLNGSVVALCHVPEGDMLQTESDELPSFLRDSPICCCLGLGIVRSIDPEEKCFYIITGVCPAELARVNCLMKGGLDLPRQILLNQPADDEGNIPYTGEPMDVVGASSVRRRRHMQRRRPADTT